MPRFIPFLMLIILIVSACLTDGSNTSSERSGIEESFEFELLDHVNTGVDFMNLIKIDSLPLPQQYINVYNGGGVATGDFDNDGFSDLYFTGNRVSNKLYLNRGEMVFEDITESSGTTCSNRWSTGVTTVDINNDGWLDIYVSHSFLRRPIGRANSLFVNQGLNEHGTPFFKEEAQKYGINCQGHSIQSSFFDMDNDGDLDLFVGNHPRNRRIPIVQHNENWNNPTLENSDRLYRNDGNRFSDVTIESGILNYGWTLGIITSDLNQDGFIDIYVAVDHGEPDRYYISQGDGTFVEQSNKLIRHTSFSSMGIDAADINNDGRQDLYVVDMLARDNKREKTQMASMDPQRFDRFVNWGYNRQNMRNMLQLNIGDGYFSEIGQFSNVHRTDWSWAPLLADFDNDGLKDLFVSNGYLVDYLDKDLRSRTLENKSNRSRITFRDLSANAISQKIPNNFFKNMGNLEFEEMAGRIGLDFKGFSSGAVYVDLDMDGDLDIITSNINDYATIHENKLEASNAWVKIELSDSKFINSKIYVYSQGKKIYYEYVPVRGYQSSMFVPVHIGLGKIDMIDSIIITSPIDETYRLVNPQLNSLLDINDFEPQKVDSKQNKELLFAEIDGKLNFEHSEVLFDDYEKQVLLPHKLSHLGPSSSAGDVNGDGITDLFIGGTNDNSPKLFFQSQGGSFEESIQFNIDSEAIKQEDISSILFDADNDGDLDLYVGTGGNESESNSEYYRDRFYSNNGKGSLVKSQNRIPDLRLSVGKVLSLDFDGDGDLDLFVGSRHKPWQYPSSEESVFLENREGSFTIKYDMDLGLVTDAISHDINGDGISELIVIGEWMSPKIIEFGSNELVDVSQKYGIDNMNGWWYHINKADFNNDGKMDFLIGNLGKNYKYSASTERPFHLYSSDFDDDGTYDIALGYYFEGDSTLYPVRGRQCSSEQTPFIKDKFRSYAEYGNASIFDIYGEDISRANSLQVTTFASSILMSDSSGYQLVELRSYAQLSPIVTSLIEDVNNDGVLDIIAGGNMIHSEIETGRCDAGNGLIIYSPLSDHERIIYDRSLGIDLSGDLRHMVKLPNVEGSFLFAAIKNNSNAILARSIN